MASYLDNLDVSSNRAQVVIADLAYELVTILDGQGDGSEQINKINWYTTLLTAANDTAQAEDLRLALLTLLVDNAGLNQVPTPTVYGLVQPLGTTSFGTVEWGFISGALTNQLDLIAKFNTYLPLAGGTMGGNITFGTGLGIVTSGILNLGTGATQVNIGGAVIESGVFSTGTWEATEIGPFFGGTGKTSLTGESGKALVVNGTEDGYDFAEIPSLTGYIKADGSVAMTASLLFADGTGIDTTGAGSLTLGGNATDVTVNSNLIVGLITQGAWNGDPIALAYGGTGAALSDPVANAWFFWENGTGAKFVTLGTNLTYDSGTSRIRVASTITSATWNGSTIGVAYGGTGLTALGSSLQYLRVNAGGTALEYATLTALVNPMTTLGDIIYGGVAGAATRLVGDTSNTKKFLSATSIGGVAQAPSWATITTSDLPIIPLSKGGTGVALADPNAYKLLGWDDGNGVTDWFTLGAGLTLDPDTLTISVSASGLVASVTGTTDEIDVDNTDPSNPIISMSPTYVGNVNITTLGTIGSGTWQASIIDGAFGGTGFDVTTLTPGDSIRVNALGTAWEAYTPGGGGSVTTVSVVSANGFAGSVANASTTPAITLTTSVTGIVKGDGTALSAAAAGTDYVAPGAITTSGLTMATARLLGRTTASTGAVEEISIGSGLSLSGGVLSGTPGGSSTELQYNNTGAFGGVSAALFDGTNLTVLSPYIGNSTSNGHAHFRRASASPTGVTAHATLFFPTGSKQMGLLWGADAFESYIEFGATADRTYTLPDTSGTFAFRDVANSWASGVKQTFNPSATTAGINVGSLAGQPSSPANGDMVYNTSANALQAYINGSWVSLGAGGGGTPGGSNTELQYNNSGSFGGITGATTNGTAVTFTTSNLLVADVRASGSGGAAILNNSGTQVALFGAGGGTGTTLVGTTNIASGSTDYVQVSGGTGVSAFTATGGSANINLTLLPKGSGAVLIGGGTAASELRFMEPSGSGTNYTAFKAQAQAGNVVYTLPAADGTTGQVLSTNGSGTLSWIAAGGSATLTIGSSAISGGTVGRVLFEGTGNVLQESANFLWDNTNARMSLGSGAGTTAVLSLAGATASIGHLLLTPSSAALTATTDGMLQYANVGGTTDLFLSKGTTPTKILTMATNSGLTGTGTAGVNVDSSGNVSRGGDVMALGIFSSISDVTTTSTSAVSVIGTLGAGNLDLPADFWAVGKTVRITAIGKISTPVTSGTVSFVFSLDGSTIYTVTSSTLSISQTDKKYKLVIDVVCRSVGGTGALQVSADLFIDMAAGSVYVVPAAGTNTINTGNVLTIDLTSQFSSASHSITTAQVFAEYLN